MGIATTPLPDWIRKNPNFRGLPKGIFPSLFDSPQALNVNSLSLKYPEYSEQLLPSSSCLDGKEISVMWQFTQVST